MIGRREQTKLHELRAKTDRQLLLLVTRRLHAGADAQRHGALDEAERAYAEAVRWQCAIADVPEPERIHLEAQVRELRRLLGRAVAAA